MVVAMTDDNQIEVWTHPVTREAGYTYLDLITSTGTLEVLLTVGASAPDGIFFRIKAPGYSLETGISNGKLYVQRNEHRAEAPFPPGVTEDVLLYATWEPTGVQAVILGPGSLRSN